jgi:hypothetical protein
MDKDFIIKSLKILLPIVLFFSYLFVMGDTNNDYDFHIANVAGLNYPPLLSWGLLAFGSFRPLGLFLINLAAVTVIPFILIYHITKKWEAAAVYLYCGGIVVMFTGWYVPQSLIICFFLLALAAPVWGSLCLLILGSFTHNFWAPLLIIAVGYHAMKSNFVREKAKFDKRKAKSITG